MERRAWIEDGYVNRREDACDEARSTVRRAWDTIVDSRESYLRGDYERANERLCGAIYVATEAMVRKHGCVPAYDFDLKLAQRLSRDVFSERVVDPLFERVRALVEMLPVQEPISEEDGVAIRHCIAAGIEYVAMTESFVIARNR